MTASEAGPGAQAPQPVGDLEARLLRLEAHLEKLESRLTGLEGVRPAARAVDRPLAKSAAPHPKPSAVAEPSSARDETSQGLGALGLTGLAFLAFGGAFFLRAMTDSGQLSRGVGVGAGMAYALLWL